MMTVTKNAEQALRRMTNTDTYPGAGLGIRKVHDDSDTFAFSIVPDPADDDIAVPGSPVYLDPPAVAALDHATLDANADATFASQFVLH
jgi:hypothetical protein